MPCYNSLLPKEIERDAGKRDRTRFSSSKPLHQGVLSIEQTGESGGDHLLVKAPMGVNMYVQPNRWDAGNLPATC